MHKPLLLVLLLCATQLVFAQRGYLNVKKNGYKKVKSFPEGAAIEFYTKQGFHSAGYIALIKKDSFQVNSKWYHSKDITKIILRKGDNLLTPFLWTTLGVALSTAGMTAAKWGTFEESLKWSAVIGYGNFMIFSLPKILKRNKYKIGKKFSVHTIDLHF